MQLKKLTPLALSFALLAPACTDDRDVGQGRPRGVPGSPVLPGGGGDQSPAGVPGSPVVDGEPPLDPPPVTQREAIIQAPLVSLADLANQSGASGQLEVFATREGMTARLVATRQDADDIDLNLPLTATPEENGAVTYRSENDEIVIRDARHVLFSALEPFVLEDVRASEEGGERRGRDAATEFRGRRRERVASALGVPGSRVLEGEPITLPQGVPGSRIINGLPGDQGLPGLPVDVAVFGFDIDVKVGDETIAYQATRVDDRNASTIYSLFVTFKGPKGETGNFETLFAPLKVLGPGTTISNSDEQSLISVVIESSLSLDEVIGQVVTRDIVIEAEPSFFSPAL